MQESQNLYGLYYIPLKPKSKVPYRSYKKNRIWRTYPSGIPNNNDPYNYGILIEENNLIILDIDNIQNINKNFNEIIFDPTFTVRSGGGGYHLYYSNINNIIPNYKQLWGEVKTKGYVVGPGSLHKTNNRYKILYDLPIQDLTDLPRWVQSPAPARGGDGFSSEKGGGKNLHSINDDIKRSNDFDFIFNKKIKQKIMSYLSDSDPDHSDKLWLVGWLYNVGNKSINDIVYLIKEYNRWNKTDKIEYYIKSVIDSIDTQYNLDINDNQIYKISNKISRDRKLSKKGGNDHMNKDKDVIYEDLITISLNDREAKAGYRFRDLVLVERRDQDETIRYVAIKNGRFIEAEYKGKTVLAKRVFSSSSIGSVSHIDQMIEALKDLRSKISSSDQDSSDQDQDDDQASLI